MFAPARPKVIPVTIAMRATGRRKVQTITWTDRSLDAGKNIVEMTSLADKDAGPVIMSRIKVRKITTEIERR